MEAHPLEGFGCRESLDGGLVSRPLDAPTLQYGVTMLIPDDWTTEDVKRAAIEGWKRQSGFVAPAYDSLGCCPFFGVVDVVEFLRNKGRNSEWHKRVYLSIPWTYADDQLSVYEGWRLTSDSILTRSTIMSFKTNDAAREYVVTNAQAGDPLHIKALSTLAKRRLTYGDQ